MSLNYIIFCIAAILAVASGIVTVTSKNPVKSAMALVVQFFMLAGLYLTLNAQFVAIVQVLVYAGAIMVLVVFVIMLLNLGDEEKLKEKISKRTVASIFGGGVLLLVIIGVILANQQKVHSISPTSITQGTVQSIGKELFTSYLIPVEAIGMLLLVAIIGAVVLAKRKID